MKILAVDSSGLVASVAVVEEDTISCSMSYMGVVFSIGTLSSYAS